MKKASEILIIIGFIFAILGAVGCLIGMITMFNLSSPQMREFIIQCLNDGSIHSTIPGTPEQQADAVMSVFRGLAVGCLFAMLFQIAVAVVSFIAMRKQVFGLYIASLVLGVLSGSVLILLGSIFGIVVVTDERQRQA